MLSKSETSCYFHSNTTLFYFMFINIVKFFEWINYIYIYMIWIDIGWINIYCLILYKINMLSVYTYNPNLMYLSSGLNGRNMGVNIFFKNSVTLLSSFFWWSYPDTFSHNYSSDSFSLRKSLIFLKCSR